MNGVVEYDISPLRGSLANVFIILVNALFFNIKLIGLNDLYPRDYSEKLCNVEESIFDFIVVGGGAAGCAVANRISAQEKWTVLLIEAGDYPSTTSEIPGLFTTLIGTKEDWQFGMEKEGKACQAFANGRCTISRGKVLGGTSTMNNLLYIRGFPEDYDKLSVAAWNSKETTKIFEKMEGNDSELVLSMQLPDTWISLNFTNYTDTPKVLLESAYSSIGVKRASKRQAIGSVDHLTLKKSGIRVNMAKSFLTPIKERPNLFLSKNTHVESIGITEPVDKRANGVNVSIDGVRFFLRARKEVILTAGAINNARLLLSSGLGSKQYLLSKKQISFKADLPGIGKNLLLRLTIPLFVAIEPGYSVCQREYYREEDLIRDAFNYIMFRTGSWSHTNINNFVAYILTQKTGTSLPNLAISHMYFKIGDRYLKVWMDAMDYHPKITNSLLNINKERAIILFMVELLNPSSRGEILLNETHYASNPIIRGNFLTDGENWDYETLLSGFDFITNLTESEIMKENKAEFLDLGVPNCRNYKFCTPAYVKCYIQNMAFPKSDAVGTAKMGSECDSDAVVQENLEIRKVRCLRVADSSVLNFMPGGNTIATDAMIGYNLGEIIKEKWLKNYTAIFKRHEE
ncbi:hypothetical protein JTB14_012522 [Gonioctena quinquepunctata]|nr:hypothetical protein JTB14_012522 [Gonioctena quinquepunctata]